MITDSLDVRIRAKSLLDHSFYQAWMAGHLTCEDLRVYAGQYYHFENLFSRFLSAIHSRSQDREVRKAVLLNLWDEEHGAKNHRELWLAFCQGLGLTSAEVEDTRMLPGTARLLSVYADLCFDGSPQMGLAAVYAYEAQVPEIMRQKLSGLGRWFGFLKREPLEFFEVHQTLDEKHSSSERALLDRYVLPGQRFDVEQAAQKALDAWWGFLDSVEATRQLARIS